MGRALKPSKGADIAVIRTADPDLKTYLAARELWQTRRRRWDDDAGGHEARARAVTEQMIDLVGQDLACHLVFEEERRYWQKRNRAAVEQKRRQDSLGLGWANHDHHTFRSSRKHFIDLMKAWEMLGFQRRERYYAGSQAGWGAQIVEQPIEGITIFNDVDLLPDETEIDFSEQTTPSGRRKTRHDRALGRLARREFSRCGNASPGVPF